MSEQETTEQVKFTPGPWTVSDERDCEEHHFASIISLADDAKGVEVAQLYGGAPYRDGEGLANARMIAAAPDMFEALCTADDAVKWYGNVDGAVVNALRRIRAALAKARGTTK